ncbi:antiviral reverse transcriptase Drt3b [Salinibacterium sp. UTAS2018]|uniref:antiviral reverse transcriptase Drt3b n=1 Tax=Salinibacterium sp. UTAS2018 TaxID=2508880 RepID=UPI00273A463E|nr:antiviral reverse transcriptase Drt3b [Salinibacterium sp. UTAS2018]
MRRVKRDPIRALVSEVLPYEVPLPFGTVGLYRFLRQVGFEWIGDTKRFRVLSARLRTAQDLRLRLIFDGTDLVREADDGDWAVYCVTRGDKARVVHPYRFSLRGNNGKIRELSVLHPQSMLEISRFVHDYRDLILFFTNRSSFSIRHPARVAKVEVKRDGVFDRSRDRDSFDIEQHNLEYDHATSYFSYRRYSNINRFYTSSEFRACERKYPTLMRADVSNCFPSVYTHTLSWVTNGRHVSKASKTRMKTSDTFGGKFDGLLQAVNYGETSGIVIGPEFSRIFAEVILQEIDVRIERELEGLGLVTGRDYEIMRYVDDYFVFLSRSSDTVLLEEVISKHLTHFKLHLNERKKEILSTPLRSNMSVAKHKIRKDLKKLTKCELDSKNASASVYFSANKVIAEYKSVLIDAELSHGELANYYLYSLGRRMDVTCEKYARFLVDLSPSAATEHERRRFTSSFATYLNSVLEVAFFAYAGAPSASHSFKLCQIIVGSVRQLADAGLPLLAMTAFKDKVRRELLAQVLAVQNEKSLGMHTLNLVDCFVFLGGELSADQLRALLESRHVTTEDLEVFPILSLFRAVGARAETKSVRDQLLARVRKIIDLGANDPDYATQRALLRLALSENLTLTPSEAGDSLGLLPSQVLELRGSTGTLIFDWGVNDHYFERLLLKSSRMVY